MSSEVYHDCEAMSFESFLTLYLDFHKRRLNKDRLPTLEELKQDYIAYLLDITGNDPRAVADILRLPTRSLGRKLKQFNLWL